VLDHQEKEAIIVDISCIPGMQPAIDNRLFGQVGLFVIAKHHHGAFTANLADFSRCAFISIHIHYT
jgi:hypothetical protein